MANALKKPLSILLAVLITVSVFAAVPITANAEESSTGSSAWIFSTSDTQTSYFVANRWFRYDGTDYQFSDDGRFSVDGNLIKLNGQTVAEIDETVKSSTGSRFFAQSVYVSGSGTNLSPYVFIPNYIYSYPDAPKISSGIDVAVTTELLSSSIKDLAYPGDGFAKCSKIKIRKNGGTGYASFLPHDGVYQTADNRSVAVGDNYGYGYGTGNTYSAAADKSFEFTTDEKILYYLGAGTYTADETSDSEPLYYFAEMRSFKRSFEGSAENSYTVTWLNEDGTLLDIGCYSDNEIPSTSVTPSKESDAWYEYVFSGWTDGENTYDKNSSLPAVSGDVTFTAVFTATQTEEHHASIDAKIFSVTDGRVYPEIEGDVFSYGGNTESFETAGGGAFAVSGNTVTLDGKTVAAFTENDSKRFAYTVFVTGSGTPADPYVFTPNYIYGKSAEYVRLGATVDVNSGNPDSKDAGSANPGDGFTAMTRMRIGVNKYAQFLPTLGYYQAKTTKGFLGVSTTTYGYGYKLAKATPYTFSDNNDTLYYFGENTVTSQTADPINVSMFSEFTPPLRTSFDETETTIYNVTWKNFDGSTITTSTHYYHSVPVYSGATPYRPSDGSTRYTFSGWSDSNGTEYPLGTPLPQVAEDTSYTAVYTSNSENLFKGHSLTLLGDIGLNYYMNVSSSEVAKGVTLNFSMTVKGVEKTSSYTLSESDRDTETGYYKAKCYVASAEMTYPITASVSVGGVTMNETDVYRVRDYADVVLNPSSQFSVNYVNDKGNDKYQILVDLVHKMLDYGAKAQTSFNRTDVELANKDISYSMDDTIDSSTLLSAVNIAKSDMNQNLAQYGLEYKGTSVVFLSKTTLRHFYVVTGDFSGTTVTFGGKDVTSSYGTRGNMIYFDCPDIAASNLNKAVDIVFSRDGLDTTTYHYSVLDYSVASLNASDATADEIALAKATYWYNQAAVTYFGS